MTKGEIILARYLQRMLNLPMDIVRLIVRHTFMRPKMHYWRRRREPRNILGRYLREIDPRDPISGDELTYLYEQFGMNAERFFGPGY
jgi:hypothetical protein